MIASSNFLTIMRLIRDDFARPSGPSIIALMLNMIEEKHVILELILKRCTYTRYNM